MEIKGLYNNSVPLQQQIEDCETQIKEHEEEIDELESKSGIGRRQDICYEVRINKLEDEKEEIEAQLSELMKEMRSEQSKVINGFKATKIL